MRKLGLLLVLVSMLLFAGACENETADPTRPAALTPAASVDLNNGEPCEWSLPSPELLATLDWEEFEGTIQPGFGGFLYAQSATWGSRVSFTIHIPAGALPAGVGATDFSLRYPVKQSYLDNWEENCENGLPLILEMEPSGLVFLKPVLVYATYMPWTDVTAADIANSSWFDNDPAGPYELLWTRTLKGGIVQFAFKAFHFSRWGVGSPNPPDPPPGGIVPIEFD